MIEAVDLVKHFEERTVLKGINAHFERGKTNLVIGKSGSGKTVMIKLLSGLLQPDGGQILFEGENVPDLSLKDKQRIQRETGMIFQNGALFDSMSVGENVGFPLRMFTKLGRKEIQMRVEECLERVDLANTMHLYPSELSGGMRKRVAIARAIAPKPKYLFCDEPNSGLDPTTGLLIDSLIHNLTHEFDITTIVNTHDMNSVLAIGDTVVFLYEGQLAWQGTGEEVLTSDNELLNAFVFATPMAQKVKQLHEERS
ncbi:MAG: ABC transporter ATP-binding protein [Bacteroidetes bacterium]|nr:MAG: ABC transporter ATP-binding protein [Bacteroidota bacterium]